MSSRLLVLPVLTAVAALTTIVVCYGLASSSGHLPRELGPVVQISLLGCTGVERKVFRAGFVTTAALLAACIAMYLRAALARFETRMHCQLIASAAFALVGALGLGIVGAVPLQTDCIDVVRGKAAIGTDSLVHECGAAAFFTASWVHGLVSIHAYGRLRRLSSRLARARRLRVACVVAPFAALVVGMAIAGSLSPLAQVQLGAAHQWISVLAMLAMYLTYVDDMLELNSADVGGNGATFDKLSDGDDHR